MRRASSEPGSTPRCATRATTSSPSTRCLPPRTAPAPSRRRTARCSTSATPSALAPLLQGRRRGVPSGRGGRGRGRTPPTRRPTAATTTTAPRCCSPRCSPRAANGWCWRRRWWSTGRAATTAREHGAGRPAAAHARRPRRRGVRAPLPGAAASRSSGGWSVRTRRCGRAACTRPARPRRSITRWRGRRRRGGSVVALRYHNVYGPFMPRDTPYSGVAAIFRSELESGDVPRVFEDGGQMRDFVHVDDVAAANVAAVDGDAGRVRGVQRLLRAGRSRSWRSPTELCEARGDAPPVVTGQYRSGDVRHIVADPARAADVLGFRAAVDPRDGLREFAFAPLAGLDAPGGRRLSLSSRSWRRGCSRWCGHSSGG